VQQHQVHVQQRRQFGWRVLRQLPLQAGQFRSHRIALRQSAKLSRAVVLWRDFTLYSALAATIPRLARYAAVEKNCFGVPFTNPPPKKC
jgi:hypothetical protein